MLTRRHLLRSAAGLGVLAATPPLLAGCGDTRAGSGSQLPRPGAAGHAALVADVSRAPVDASSVPEAAAAVQAFTADLYRRLAGEVTGNVVCSPYSVAVALAMTRNGARGQTAHEMDRVLHAQNLAQLNVGLNALTKIVESRAGEVRLPDGRRATVALDVTNSIWGQRGKQWKQAFLVALARYYGAGLRVVDYMRATEAAREAINAWTAKQTHRKIRQILPPGLLDPSTRLVLVNAIYLKAPWLERFQEDATRKRSFTRADGRRVHVDMMVGHFESARYAEGPGWRVAHLPYFGGEIAMTILVPDGDVARMERLLDGPQLQRMLTAERALGALTLYLPRWRFRLASPLEGVLAALGMPTAFDATRADFSGMDGERDLSISAVQHDAFIAVDERGTEAAAATAVVMRETAAIAPPVELVVDRPFLFVIHDRRTATPLFIGRVDDPTATG